MKSVFISASAVALAVLLSACSVSPVASPDSASCTVRVPATGQNETVNFGYGCGDPSKQTSDGVSN